jgi:hypothetical protein
MLANRAGTAIRMPTLAGSVRQRACDATILAAVIVIHLAGALATGISAFF